MPCTLLLLCVHGELLLPRIPNPFFPALSRKILNQNSYVTVFWIVANLLSIHPSIHPSFCSFTHLPHPHRFTWHAFPGASHLLCLVFISSVWNTVLSMQMLPKRRGGKWKSCREITHQFLSQKVPGWRLRKQSIFYCTSCQHSGWTLSS